MCCRWHCRHTRLWSEWREKENDCTSTVNDFSVCSFQWIPEANFKQDCFHFSEYLPRHPKFTIGLQQHGNNYLQFWFLLHLLIYMQIRWCVSVCLTFSLHADPFGPLSLIKYLSVYLPAFSKWSFGWPTKFTMRFICRHTFEANLMNASVTAHICLPLFYTPLCNDSWGRCSLESTDTKGCGPLPTYL